MSNQQDPTPEEVQRAREWLLQYVNSFRALAEHIGAEAMLNDAEWYNIPLPEMLAAYAKAERLRLLEPEYEVRMLSEKDLSDIKLRRFSPETGKEK